jgi:D-sedoheptulose 7-phosphate isomerase
MTIPERTAAAISDHIAAVDSMRAMIPKISEIGNRMASQLKAGGKILWMGNGGSAADCQHMAAEIVGRFVKERRGLPSIALTTDTSILTAVGNDYGFDHIFSRQIEALCSPIDVVIGISTSGNSQNVVQGVLAAKNIGAYTIGMTGRGGGKLLTICNELLAAPSEVTARIQECHILLGHLLCECIDAQY